MPANPSPKSAKAQAARPQNRGDRRAEASQSEQPRLTDALASPVNFDFNLANLSPLLRISDICRDKARGYPGILPMTRSAFLTAVEDGYIKKPIRLGGKVVAWRREDILEIIKNGVVGRREQGRRARARAAQRQAAAETALNT